MNISNLSNIMITFVDKNKNCIKALKSQFDEQYNVSIVKGDITSVGAVDCLVVPGNSFGLMYYSVDNTVRLLVEEYVPRIQNVINNIYYGEQPVGTCIILPTNNHPKYKFIAHVPTMVAVPKSSINSTDSIKDLNNTRNAYLAFRALLSAVLNHNKINDNKIQSIVTNSFCTEYNIDDGGMDPEEAAKQMRLAFGFIDIGITCAKDNADFVTSLLY